MRVRSLARESTYRIGQDTAVSCSLFTPRRPILSFRRQLAIASFLTRKLFRCANAFHTHVPAVAKLTAAAACALL